MASSKRSTRGTTLFMTGLIGALLLTSGRGEGALILTLVTWFLACIAVEALWHFGPDEVTPLSMAPGVHLAAVVSLPVFWGVPLITVAAFLGAALWRRPGRRAPVVQMLATAAAGVGALAIVVLGKVQGLSGAIGTPGETVLEPRHFLLIGLAGLVYMALYQGLIAMASGRQRGVTGLNAWQDVFGRETELVTAGALITVATLTVFCHEALGYRGLLLCVMPILFVRDGSRRNIELERAQGKLIQNERLAAKGEMAAEIGHELNNYLAAISGRAQLVLRKLTPGEDPKMDDEAGRVRDIANQMGELAKGLMDFSHRDVQRTSFGINELIEKTVDFVRPQTRFQDWNFDLDSDPQIPRVQIDPGQIQQVLLILFSKIADSPLPRSHQMLIKTYRDESSKSVGIEIKSPQPVAAVGTEPDGVDADAPVLDTVRRILDHHRGKFSIEDSGDGEAYRVYLPAA